MSDALGVLSWTENDVINYLQRERSFENRLLEGLRREGIDGKALLAFTEHDIRDLKNKDSCLRLGDLKHFWIIVRQIQKENHTNLVNLGLIETSYSGFITQSQQHTSHHQHQHHVQLHHHCSCCSDISGYHDMERISPPLSIDGRATSIKPEIFKTMISLCELNK